MMSNLVIERDTLIQMMEDWLNQLRVAPTDRLQVMVSEDSMVIRPQSAEHAELDEWLDQVTRQYDSVFRRLAVS
ncbi:MAG: hypothetical protein B6D41_02660 [Chloroflexi bacterium UTCFX4]|nr:MAG: hypothetical protein B6D41_02660 [Chloroflexi bacterium UTCFX4]